MKEPLVSICCITYNHEKYISQAIEGFLMQKTGFPVEIVIGEDFSTDNTRAVCLEYKEKYPDKIKLLLPEKNLGMMQNFVATMQACTGKYIALCEGDDYWINPLKLQKQVDFLEQNPDFSICFHSVKLLMNNELTDDYITEEVSDITDIYDLAIKNYIHTCSVVFRKNEEVVQKMRMTEFPFGDYPLHLLNAQYGKIKKINEIMGVYRVHSGGILHSSSFTYNSFVVLYEKLISLFNNDKKLINIFSEQKRFYTEINLLVNELSKIQNSKEMKTGKLLLSPLRKFKKMLN